MKYANRKGRKHLGGSRGREFVGAQPIVYRNLNGQLDYGDTIGTSGQSRLLKQCPSALAPVGQLSKDIQMPMSKVYLDALRVYLFC